MRFMERDLRWYRLGRKETNCNWKLIIHVHKQTGCLCLLLLFHCSYYTIKSNEKEAENPVFTRGYGWDAVYETVHIFIGLQRNFPPSFCRFECFRLFDFKTGHEPVELLPGQLLYFQLISGPAESALDFHAFIQ